MGVRIIINGRDKDYGEGRAEMQVRIMLSRRVETKQAGDGWGFKLSIYKQGKGLMSWDIHLMLKLWRGQVQAMGDRELVVRIIINGRDKDCGEALGARIMLRGGVKWGVKWGLGLWGGEG